MRAEEALEILELLTSERDTEAAEGLLSLIQRRPEAPAWADVVPVLQAIAMGNEEKAPEEFQRAALAMRVSLVRLLQLVRVLRSEHAEARYVEKVRMWAEDALLHLDDDVLMLPELVLLRDRLRQAGAGVCRADLVAALLRFAGMCEPAMERALLCLQNPRHAVLIKMSLSGGGEECENMKRMSPAMMYTIIQADQQSGRMRLFTLGEDYTGVPSVRNALDGALNDLRDSLVSMRGLMRKDLRYRSAIRDGTEAASMGARSTWVSRLFPKRVLDAAAECKPLAGMLDWEPLQIDPDSLGVLRLMADADDRARELPEEDALRRRVLRRKMCDWAACGVIRACRRDKEGGAIDSISYRVGLRNQWPFPFWGQLRAQDPPALSQSSAWGKEPYRFWKHLVTNEYPADIPSLADRLGREDNGVLGAEELALWVQRR